MSIVIVIIKLAFWTNRSELQPVMKTPNSVFPKGQLESQYSATASNSSINTLLCCILGKYDCLETHYVGSLFIRSVYMYMCFSRMCHTRVRILESMMGSSMYFHHLLAHSETFGYVNVLWINPHIGNSISYCWLRFYTDIFSFQTVQTIVLLTRTSYEYKA